MEINTNGRDIMIGSDVDIYEALGCIRDFVNKFPDREEGKRNGIAHGMHSGNFVYVYWTKTRIVVVKG